MRSESFYIEEILSPLLQAPEKKKTTFKVVKHHQGTQTMPGPVVKVKGQPAAKIRLASLNQQVAVLTKAKHSHARVSIAHLVLRPTHVNSSSHSLQTGQVLVLIIG